MSVGFGYDIHRLVPGRRLVLGGVEISHPAGLLGHSDGDVLLHAVIDALLGAAGLGDIGRKFPDTDPSLKDVSSETLLRRVLEEILPRWKVGNVDVTVVAGAPKLAPHHEAIRRKVSAILGTDRVNIKAKTGNGLGSEAEGAAIGCYAVAELEASIR
jgi:2-C-methyl-D-erythritol 2,4-cyclodiphosphate synthase